MKNNKTLILLILVLAAALGGAPVFAQAVSTIQISGSVQDATGAVIPGAQITATQTATGLTRTVSTNSDGTYVISQLPVGPYQISAEKTGFKGYIQTGIVIQVGENPTINVTLQVGAVEQSVEVSANAAMIQTRETSVSTVIDQGRIVELPLNGRQATQLILLAGGAVPSGIGNFANSKNYPSSVSLSVAGGQGDATNYVLDGADHNDAFSNVNQPFPFPDALQEFSVQTSTLSARYGLHPGATVNAVTKSGTNQLHGSAFEFLRNGSLNSRNFFAAKHDTLKRNQFGGTFGGPVKRDKIFFFGGFQGTRNRQAPPETLAFAPTAAALTGDFNSLESAACQSNGRARTLNDPATGAPFANNLIPVSRLSPQGLALATKFLPSTNDPCGAIRFGIPTTGDENQFVGRTDWVQSAKHTVFARYLVADYQNPGVFDGKNLLTTSRPGVLDRVQNVVLSDTYTLTPQLVNGIHARYSRTAINRGAPANMINPTAYGVNLVPLVPNHVDLNVSGAFVVGCGTCAPAHFMTNSIQISDDVDYIRGRHQISFGGQVISNQLNWLAHTLSNGQFTVNGQFTNDRLADLMLGLPSFVTKGGPLATWLRQKVPELYAHDVWRARPNLTVNLGMRWEPFLPETDIYNQGTHIDPLAFAAGTKTSVYSNAPPGFFFYGDPGIPRAYTHNRLADLEPRLGLAWHPKRDANTTIRASYGIFYQTAVLFYSERFSQISPFGNRVDLPSPRGGLSNPLQELGGDPFPFPFPPKKDAPFVGFGSFLNMPLDMRPSYTQQWNLSVQRQVGADWLLSATYLGNKTTHLWLQTEGNPAVYIPGNSTTGNTNQRRRLYLINPAPTAGGLVATIATADDGGNGNYNGLMLSVNRRFSKNFSALANYTWSHCIAEGEFQGDLLNPTYQNPDNRRGDRSNCTFDHRQLFNFSFLASSPANFRNPLARHILGHWELSLIVSRFTGDFFSITSGRDNSLTGVGLDRADVAGSPLLENPTLVKYFNTAAFAQNQTGRYGNSGRNIVPGPNLFNMDIGLNRRIAIREGKAFEIRSEFFNALNHPNFGDPRKVLTDSLVGSITTTGSADPRILQFALKFGF